VTASTRPHRYFYRGRSPRKLRKLMQEVDTVVANVQRPARYSTDAPNAGPHPHRGGWIVLRLIRRRGPNAFVRRADRKPRAQSFEACGDWRLSKTRAIRGQTKGAPRDAPSYVLD